MRSWRVTLAVFGFSAIHSVASLSSAAVNYDWVTDNNNGTYGLLPNGQTTVQVYLRETLTAGSGSQLVSENGLFSGAALVTRTVSPVDPADILSSVKNPEFGGFSNSAVTAGGASATVGGSGALVDPPEPGPTIIVDSATVRRALIGTLTVQAGLIPLETSNFTLSDPPDTNTLTNLSGIVLDSVIATGSFTVTVLPEPATLGLGGLALGGLLLRRRRNV